MLKRSWKADEVEAEAVISALKLAQKLANQQDRGFALVEPIGVLPLCETQGHNVLEIIRPESYRYDFKHKLPRPSRFNAL